LALAGKGVSPAGISPDSRTADSASASASTLRAPPPTTNTQRNPLLSFRLPGLFLLRYEDRKLTGALLFHAAPRNTRAVTPPDPLPGQPHGPPEIRLLQKFSSRFAARKKGKSVKEQRANQQPR
jgi:hypothetical protein